MLGNHFIVLVCNVIDVCSSLILLWTTICMPTIQSSSCYSIAHCLIQLSYCVWWCVHSVIITLHMLDVILAACIISVWNIVWPDVLLALCAKRQPSVDWHLKVRLGLRYYAKVSDGGRISRLLGRLVCLGFCSMTTTNIDSIINIAEWK